MCIALKRAPTTWTSDVVCRDDKDPHLAFDVYNWRDFHVRVANAIIW